MPKASDNEFPSVLLKEGTTPASPAAGDQRVFLDSADHKFKRVNSSGTVTVIESAASGGGALGQLFDSKLTTTAASFDTGAGTLDQTGNHLLIEFQLQTDQASNQSASLRFNADSGTNYDWLRFNFTLSNTSTISSAQSATGILFADLVPGSGMGASFAANGFIKIQNYTDTHFVKGVQCELYWYDGTASGSSQRWVTGGVWHPATQAAITRIQIIPGAGNWAAGSHVSIYKLT